MLKKKLFPPCGMTIYKHVTVVSAATGLTSVVALCLALVL